MKRLRELDDVGACLGVTLAPLDLHAGRYALPLPRRGQFRRPAGSPRDKAKYHVNYARHYTMCTALLHDPTAE